MPRRPHFTVGGPYRYRKNEDKDIQEKGDTPAEQEQQTDGQETISEDPEKDMPVTPDILKEAGPEEDIPSTGEVCQDEGQTQALQEEIQEDQPKSIPGQDTADMEPSPDILAPLQLKINPIYVDTEKRGRLEPGARIKDLTSEIYVKTKKVNISPDSLRIKIDQSGCTINDKPFNPDDPPEGMQIFVDKKEAKSED